jgi:hypothetical protein
MLVLRRDFHDGPERPDLVLLHYEVLPEGGGAPAFRHTLVLQPLPSGHGLRETEILLPEPAPGERYAVRYAYSALRHGSEWFSPSYETVLPGEEDRRIVETGGGNPRPSVPFPPFRLPLPVEEWEAGGTVRFGYGAMRKKPSPDLCRVTLPAGDSPPQVEIPATLSVLKGRPMPYYLHYVFEGGAVRSRKIACARVTCHDPDAEIVAARVVWGDAEWSAQNVTSMGVKGFDPVPAPCDHCFAEDPHGVLTARAGALEAAERGHHRRRTFEAFVFGPEGKAVEYCFQVTARRHDGTFHATWRNLDGGNWTIVL